jgi:hypothetical protein
MTGGEQGFGVGGYHRSPVEDVLPVTMEIREQQRRFGLALAIALDRSGSMRQLVGGVPKMQLANRGAASSIDLLSPIDGIALLAVDTEAEVVQELVSAVDKDAVAARARTIESSGGGIYVGAALAACALQLESAAQHSRHIVLFADADDSEQPGDYQAFVPELVKKGISVSVIGLGDAGGRDAGLLEEIAQLGQGRCQFVADPADLPRVFAQETIQVARSSLTEEPCDVVAKPALALLGDMPTTLPRLGGYSIAWQRDRAERDLESGDDDAAPLLAHWQCGLGRSAAFLGEADGARTGAWGAWAGYSGFFATLVRWLGGGSPSGVFVDARRDGDFGVYTIEVDGADAAALDVARGVATAPDGTTAELAFDRVASGRIVARVPLVSEGVHRAALQVGDDTVRLPPLCRPYSAEWGLEADARAGERTLRRLTRATGGFVSPSVADVLSGPRLGGERRDLAGVAAWLVVVLLLAEIAVRRLQVHLALPRWQRRPKRVGKAAKEVPVPGGERKVEAGEELLDALERAHRRGKRRV